MSIHDDRKKINTIIEANNYGCINLTDWECNFLDSIDLQLDGRKELTWKQVKVLNKIYARIE